jgi:tetratricopeptide (TPR) repeat protein
MRRAVLAVALLCAAAPALRAQPDAPVSEEEKAVARQHFQKAKDLHEKKQYIEAAAEYLEAYKHMPAPAFIYNAGQVYRLGGEKEKAVEHYRRYLELEPNGEGADDARQFIAELSAAIEAEKSQGGAAPPAGPVAGGGVPGTGPAPPEGGTEDRPGRGLMVAGLVSGGIGAAALAAAVVFAAKASSAESDLDGFRGTWTPEQRDRYASGESAERNMKVSLVVSAVGLAAGGAMFFLGRRQARAAGQTPTIGAAADGQSALLLLGGSF